MALAYKAIKSKDLFFDPPYISLTEWNGVICAVFPFNKNGTYDVGLTKRWWERHKRVEFVSFKNDFTYFGRRAIAFMRNLERFFQFETYGEYPYLIKETMKYATRGILVLNRAELNENKKRTLDYISQRPYLIRTYADKTTRGEMRRIKALLNKIKVPLYYWEIVGDDEFYKKLTRRSYGKK